MDDCTTGVFGSSVSSSVQVSAAVVYHIASFFTSQAHSSISASPGKSLRIFMCRELYSQLTPVYKSSIRFSSLLWRTALLLLLRDQQGTIFTSSQALSFVYSTL